MPALVLDLTTSLGCVIWSVLSSIHKSTDKHFIFIKHQHKPNKIAMFKWNAVSGCHQFVHLFVIKSWKSSKRMYILCTVPAILWYFGVSTSLHLFSSEIV